MQALILFKPDVFERRMLAVCFKFLEDNDFEIKDAKLLHPCVPTAVKLGNHYAEHAGKPFYDGLLTFMNSGKLFAIAGELPNIAVFRQAMQEFRLGWMEGGPRNLIHCSDSPEAATRELNIWFPQH
jgi:nucleoside-diphosphate kinase